MKIYTPEKVAELLSVHKETVRRWLRNGELKGIKINTAWRITQEQLDEFLYISSQENH